MTDSVRPCGDGLPWVVKQWTVGGEMLMPLRTASKVGLVWNDSAAWVSVQTAIESQTQKINEFTRRPRAA